MYNTRTAPDVRTDFEGNVGGMDYEQYLHRQYIKAELEETQRRIDAGEVKWFPAHEVLAEARARIEKDEQL